MKNYIVLDLEWNQSPNGKQGENKQIPFEIIEIGAVKLDQNRRYVSEFSQVIKPKVYKELHFMISQVTHMDMEELNEGKSFVKAYQEFIDWCGDDFIFCTWGSMDLTELQKNMDFYRISNSLPKPLLYYDIQKLYSILYGDGKNRIALDGAIEELGIKMRRPFHRAADDAKYTGRIMKAMDFGKVQEYYSVDYHRPPETRQEEIHLVFKDYSKFVSRMYETKEDALVDRQVVTTKCYRCGRALRKKIRWFSSNGKFYFCLAICPTHGYLRGKLRMKKADNGKIYVVKTLKLDGEEGAAAIRTRQDELRQRRRERRKKERLMIAKGYSDKNKKRDGNTN